jgi:hypothetical protein
MFGLPAGAGRDGSPAASRRGNAIAIAAPPAESFKKPRLVKPTISCSPESFVGHFPHDFLLAPADSSLGDFTPLCSPDKRIPGQAEGSSLL